MILPLIILGIEWILILWIMITTTIALKKVAPVLHVKHLELMKGIWLLEIALGLSLAGLAGLGSITAIQYPMTFGILMLWITLAVFLLTYKATRDLERVPLIAHYSEKIKKWVEKSKR